MPSRLVWQQYGLVAMLTRFNTSIGLQMLPLLGGPDEGGEPDGGEPEGGEPEGGEPDDVRTEGDSAAGAVEGFCGWCQECARKQLGSSEEAVVTKREAREGHLECHPQTELECCGATRY